MKGLYKVGVQGKSDMFFLGLRILGPSRATLRMDPGFYIRDCNMTPIKAVIVSSISCKIRSVLGISWDL